MARYSTRQIDFVAGLIGPAKRAQLKTGVPYRFSIAQAALESGWGKHAPGNMLFGVKWTGTGPKQLLTTWEASRSGRTPRLKAGEKLIRTYRPGAAGNPFKSRAWAYRVKVYFRAFPTRQASLEHHGEFLKKNSRYRKAFDQTGSIAFGRQVARAGYATDPGYEAKLVKVIGDIANIENGLKTGNFKSNTSPPKESSPVPDEKVKKGAVVAALAGILIGYLASR